MSREFAIKILEEKGEVALTCNGNSMTPILHKGEQIIIKKVSHKQLRKDDAVFVRINRNLQVHKITAIDKARDRFQISNAHGHINGWVKPYAIYGLAVKVADRILVSDEELIKRLS